MTSIFYQKTSVITSTLDGLTFKKAGDRIGVIMREKGNQGVKTDLLEENSAKYKSALASRVMTCLSRVLRREKIDPAERARIRAIVNGRNGQAELSDAAVKALSKAALLGALSSTPYQLNAPGWRDVYTQGGMGDSNKLSYRRSSYLVRLPSFQDITLQLRAKPIPTDGRRVTGLVDFQRWIIVRRSY